MTATPHSVLTVPTTDLGDLLRSRHTPSRTKRWLTAGARGVMVTVIAMVGMLSIGTPTANAWLLDDAVSKIPIGMNQGRQLHRQLTRHSYKGVTCGHQDDPRLRSGP